MIVLFGGIMAGVGFYRARRDQASLTWPTTPALIASAVQGNYRATGISPTIGLGSVLLSLPFWYLAARWFSSAALPSRRSAS